MHSFRPVFALPPCAPHTGDRSTPVTLYKWGTHCTGGLSCPCKRVSIDSRRSSNGHVSDRVRRTCCQKMGECVRSDGDQSPNTTGRRHRDAANINLHALVTINASFISYIVEINTHSRTFWQRARPSIRKRGPQAPFFGNYACNGGYIRQSYRVRYGNRNRSTSKRSPASPTSP